MISDGKDFSAAQFLSKGGQALNHPSSLCIKVWIVPIPILIMAFEVKILGKGAKVDYLLGFCRSIVLKPSTYWARDLWLR